MIYLSIYLLFSHICLFILLTTVGLGMNKVSLEEYSTILHKTSSDEQEARKEKKTHYSQAVEVDLWREIVISCLWMSSKIMYEVFIQFGTCSIEEFFNTQPISNEISDDTNGFFSKYNKIALIM
jgi:hypothetical protein